MLFNSYAFLFFFLPIVAIGFFWIARFGQRSAALWMAVASLFFYAWWNPKYILLILASIGFNYMMGRAIGDFRSADPTRPRSLHILAAAIAVNLTLLGYYKYSNFFVDTYNHLGGTNWGFADVVLPLGISFFTFTQIAFLIDVYRGIAREYNFIHYTLFVTYFPHLIAGPLLHHKQVMPQFDDAETYRMQIDNLCVGLTIFTLGLAKKVLLADQLSPYADQVFDFAANGGEPMLVEAWIGVLAYTLQIYFDFSGYSDMAIGLSLIFNVKLPFNFNSPYKATSVIEFWRRWHMTLSAFLRDYLYIPLGGNRRGVARRYVNMLVTMLLGGLWHGASWNFVIWGGLHGIYLGLNHVWRKLSQSTQLPRVPGGKLIAAALTFIAVAVAWVPFRAAGLESAMLVMRGMAGLQGTSLPAGLERHLSHLASYGVQFSGAAPATGLPMIGASVWLLVGTLIIWLLPNTQQWVTQNHIFKDRPSWSVWLAWRPNLPFALACGLLLAASVANFYRPSPFIYFQF